MQIAAKTVMEEYQGKLPADYEKLLTLKGIGHYTAGAIASIAYGIPEMCIRDRTQTINFYNINDVMYLVDLPGYGYAKVAESEKKKWGQMIENYLHNSKQLRAVFLLIDIRHAPSANDKMMYDWIVYQGYEPIIIATKMDKLKRSQISKHVKLGREGLGLKKESIVIPFSATSKQGREEIWNLMDSILESEVSENEDE